MYSFRSRVRFSEIGEDGKLKLSSIINYFQDCSTFQTEDLGIGFQYLDKESKVWILSSWQVIVNEFANLCDEIIINTWPYDFKGFYGFRNFTMTDTSGKILAYANSVWIYLDTETGKPSKITEEVMKGYALEDRISMDYAPRKIALPENFTIYEEFPVRGYHIDTNDHVNNGQYIQMAREFIPKDYKIKQMRADYRKAALLGDRIVPMVHENPEKYTVVLSDMDKNPYVTVEFYK